MERIQKELDEIEGRLDKIAETKKVPTPKRAASAMPQDATLKVRMDVNFMVLPLPKDAKALPPVAGCSAYRLGDESLMDPSETGATLVLVGTWSEKNEAGIRRVEPFPGARDRHLHVFRKAAETPSRFPRRPGMARKRPLGA